ncbi:hypothetical protein [Stutzerimonas xanthomarina]|uniref:hypothetical protein n=2 Tax=Gammaproteobacteria TaxID=1236 RepID=UPI003AA9202F
MAELNAEPALMTLENLRANFVNEQPEYEEIYGGLTRDETIIEIYNNLFGRAPDATGLAYWSTGEGAAVNADQLVVAFLNGASAADAQVVTNKVLVASIYTSAAGDNFSTEDAAAILVGVDGTTASVSDAIAGLTDLPSVAVPAAIGLIEAAAVAAKSLADFENEENTDALIAINDDVAALNTAGGYGATLADLDADSDDEVSYTEAEAALANAEDVRDAVSGLSTGVLSTQATEAAADLAAARTTLVNGTNGAVAAVRAFEAAIAADAALTAPAQADVDLRTAQLEATAQNSGAAWSNAITAAKLTAPVTADDLFALLADTATSASVVSAVNTAFAGIEGFSAVSTLAAQANAKAAADAKVQTTAQAVDDLSGTAADDYLDAFDASVAAQELLKDAQAADALVNAADAIVSSHDSLEQAVSNANTALNNSAAEVYAAGFTGTSGADVFYFAAGDLDQTLDINVTDAAFNAGDALYIGQGYTLSSVTELSDTGALVGGNNSAKEIFFIQNGTDVNVVVETAEFGSSTAAANLAVNATDNVAVITLLGVNAEDLSFSNGVISYVA